MHSLLAYWRKLSLTDWGFATGCFFGLWANLGLPLNSAQKRRTRNSGRAITAIIEIEHTIATPAVAMISGAS